MLFIVGTPIGNVEDVTFRAQKVLGSADLVLCEDTRKTSVLFEALGVSVKTDSFHHHTSDAKRAKVIEQLKQGSKIALVTDAGTPGVSDPGGMLVQDAYAAGVEVVPVPGVSAVTTLLSVSGLPSDSFQFLGFFPRKKGRQTLLGELGTGKLTTVFFESPHRIQKTLTALAEALPQSTQMVVGRELTKQYEEIMRGTPGEVAEHFNAKDPKGEFTIVIGPRP